MGFLKALTGYTDSTPKNLQLGAGVILKNYDVSTDTFSSAVEARKLLGATQGGSSISIKPIVSEIQVDGVQAGVIGMSQIESWEVTLNTNILEVTEENIKLALGAANSEAVSLGTSGTAKSYKKITGKTQLETSDYIDNITFLGNISGSEEPIIVQIFGALATDGLNINPQDKKQTLVPTKFVGHNSFSNIDEPPFAIYVPVQTEA